MVTEYAKDEYCYYLIEDWPRKVKGIIVPAFRVMLV